MLVFGSNSVRFHPYLLCPYAIILSCLFELLALIKNNSYLTPHTQASAKWYKILCVDMLCLRVLHACITNWTLLLEYSWLAAKLWRTSDCDCYRWQSFVKNLMVYKTMISTILIMLVINFQTRCTKFSGSPIHHNMYLYSAIIASGCLDC